MEKKDIEHIISLQKKLENDRNAFTQRWEDVRKYVLPELGDIFHPQQQGVKRTAEIYDSSANLSCNTLATNIHNTLTSAASQWFSLNLRNKRLADKTEVNEWLKECSKILYWSFYYSNFDSCIQQTWLMLPSVGTSVLFFGDVSNTGKFRFKSIPITQVCIVENEDGIVNTVFWKFKLSAKDIFERLGEAIPEVHRIRECAEKEPYRMFDVLHYAAPKGEYVTANAQQDYCSVYILFDEALWLNPKGEKCAGFYEFPYMVPRYQLVPNECYGRSPAMLAMGDIKTLNKIIELKLQGAELTILPPFLNENGCVNVRDGKINPGKIYDKSLSGEFKPMEVGADIRIAELEIEEYRKRIRETFHYDALMLYPDKNYQTAYEVSRHEANILRLLGPATARFKYELLNPIVERGFNLLLRAGKLPDMPGIMQGTEIDIEYIGPLAKAQMLSEVQSIETLMMSVAQLAQFKPEIIKALKEYDIVKRIQDRVGAPTEILVSAEEYNESLSELQQQQQMAAQASAFKEGAQGFQAAAMGQSVLNG